MFFLHSKETLFEVNSENGEFNLYAPQTVSRLAFSFTAAAIMAVEHFNSRNTSIVPELADLDNCTFTLEMPRLVDSEASGKTSVRALWDLTGSDDEEQPCAILGPVNEEANFDLVSAANAFDIPLLSYYNENELLAQKTGTLGMTLSLDGRVKAMIDYLEDIEYLSVWHTATRQGTAFADTLADRAAMLEEEKEKILEIEVFRDNFGEDVFDKLKQMRDVGYKTIYLSLWEPSALVGYAGELERLNMLEGDYLYYLDSDLVPSDYTEELFGAQRPGSPIDKLLSGALVFDRLDGFRRFNVSDPFETVWKTRGADDVSLMNSIVPDTTYYYAAAEYFQTLPPSNYASFAYDSVITVGLGGCQAEKVGDSLDGDNRRQLQLQTVVDPNRGRLLRNMQNVTFHGASGRVAFGQEEGQERNSEDVTVGLYNIVPNEIVEGNRTYRSVLVSQYRPETGWQDIPGVEIVYRDGTKVPPDTARFITNENHISVAVRIIGLVLMSISLTVAFTCLLLLKKYEKDAVVLRAQPFFMRILCIGSMLMSCSIFTLSWDEGAGWSNAKLSVACMLTQWFFFFGQILTFCALFTKLWRVDRVLQFRRTAVTILNVMKPTLALLFCTISILITWTIVDPWAWKRELISELPAETFGQCTCAKFWPFFGSLIGLLFCAEILTFYFAWKTADVPEDFRDSAAVMYASFAQLQSFAVGIPMLAVLGTSSVDATYFGRIFLIWIFAVSSVAVVVGPKIVKAYKLRQAPQLQPNRKRVSVTGLYTPMKNTTITSNSVDKPKEYENKSQIQPNQIADDDGSESISMSMGACTERIKQVAAAYAAQEKTKY